MTKKLLLMVILIGLLAYSYINNLGVKPSLNKKNKNAFSKQESKDFIENVKIKYRNLTEYKSNGQITRLLYVLPDFTSNSIEQNFLVMSTRKDIKFQLNSETPNKFNLTFDSYESDTEEISFPAWSVKNPKEYVENNINDKIEAKFKESGNFVKDKAWVKIENEKIMFSTSKNSPANEALSFSEAMEEIYLKTRINFILPTVFYAKDYDSFTHYINLEDLHIENEEEFDETSCYILEGTSFKEKDSYMGIFVKMWIGKEDFLIRKIENYNAFDLGIVYTGEIHQNIVTK